MRVNVAPMLIKAHLKGDTVALKPWMGEGVYSNLAADIRIRKTVIKNTTVAPFKHHS